MSLICHLWSLVWIIFAYLYKPTIHFLANKSLTETNFLYSSFLQQFTQHIIDSSGITSLYSNHQTFSGAVQRNKNIYTWTRNEFLEKKNKFLLMHEKMKPKGKTNRRNQVIIFLKFCLPVQLKITPILTTKAQ